MKKYRLKIFSIVLITIFGCSDTDTNFESPIQGELNGTWRVIAYNFEGRTDVIDIEEIENTNFTDFVGIAGTIDLVMEFNTTGEFNFNGFYYLENQIFPNEGQASFFVQYLEVEEQGMWNLSGNALTINVGQEIREIGISELTDTSLILRLNTTTSDALNENQIVISSNKQETYVLERL